MELDDHIDTHMSLPLVKMSIFKVNTREIQFALSL